MTLLGELKKQAPSNETIISEAINAIGDDRIIKLKQLNAKGCNALMLTVIKSHLHKDFDLILTAAQGLDKADRAEILMHVTPSLRANALMYAVRWSPEAALAILASIECLDINAKKTILKQISSADKTNALVIAVHYNQFKVALAILKSMESLSKKDQSAIMKQYSSGGDALMQARKHCVKAVMPLFKAHLAIGNHDILFQFRCIVETLSKKRPNDLSELFKTVGHLSYVHQMKLYGSLTPTEYAQKHFQHLADNSDARKALREAVSHAEVRYHLAKLKQKADELDKKIGFNQHHCYLAPANEARILHQTLANSYEAFMRGEPLSAGISKKSPTESSRLLDVWADAINRAKPILSQHRGITETVFRLCTLVFTPFLWMCNAMQGRSFKFFPYSPETDTMYKVNQVMRALQNEMHFHALQNESDLPPPYDADTGNVQQVYS